MRVRGPGAITRALRSVLSSVTIPEPDLPALDIVISDAAEARGMIGDAMAWTITLPRRGWLAPLLGYVVGTATSALRSLLFVHAAVVALKGRGFVLVGTPWAGKSSAAAVLIRHGAAYLSDEVALLDPETGTLHPFALPLAVKPWTAAAIGPLPPVREVAAEGGVRYLLPSRMSGPVPLDSVILLEAGRPPRDAVAVSPAEMLLNLSQHPSSFRYRPRLEAAFTGFVQILRHARCLQVGSSVPAETAAVVSSLPSR